MYFEKLAYGDILAVGDHHDEPLEAEPSSAATPKVGKIVR